MRNVLLISASAIALMACDLAPELKLPEVSVPPAFKEEAANTAQPTVEPATDGKWKRFDERAKIDEFAWWRMFNDGTLDGLMEKAMKDNPSLDSALARVESARATAGIRAADQYPSVGIGFGPERIKQSPAAQEPNLPPGTPANVKPYTLYNAQGSINYEIDLFGRNRNRTEAAQRDAEAEANNYRAARLSLQAELAQTYYRLAALRAEELFLAQTIEIRQDALILTHQKLEAGVSDTLAFAAAETDLATIQAEYETIRDARARTEHALAVLIGIPPSELRIDLTTLDKEPPSVPVGMPSSLLERRPDIHRAAEAIAAANARIGVARTGYFPDISLSIGGGFTSGELGELFKWSNRSWLIGPLAGTMLTQPIFEGGRVAATRAQADANYKAAVGDYRGAVLQAFREVEDQLSGLQSANERMKAAEYGITAANRAYDVARERFEAGYTSHLEYLDAERSRLAAERSKIQVRGDQYITTIQLIRALGGSWQAPSTPESTGTVLDPVAPLPVTPDAAPMKEEVAPQEAAPASIEQPAAPPEAQKPAEATPEPVPEQAPPAPPTLLPEPMSPDALPPLEAPPADAPATPAPADPISTPVPRTDGTI